MRRQLPVLVLFFGLSLLAGSASAASHCVNPQGTGGCFSSINTAVNDASVVAGDTVSVTAGLYVETAGITIPAGKDGLRLAGPPTAIIDPSYRNGSSAVALAVASNGVTVTGLMFRNIDNDAIQVSGTGFTLSASKITRARGYGVTFADGASTGTVRNSIIEGTYSQAIHIGVADNMAILANTISKIDSGGIYAATSHNLHVIGNKIQNTWSSAVQLDTGDGAIVQKNVFSTNSGYGIYIGTGNGASISYNRMINLGDGGIYVTTGSGASILNNSISYADAVGIYVSGDGSTVSHNAVLQTASEGIQAYGNNSIVSYNRIIPGLDSDGILASGNGIQMLSNSVNGGSFGISGTGDQPKVMSNKITATSEAGIFWDCSTVPYDSTTSQCTGGMVNLNKVSQVAASHGLEVDSYQQIGQVEVGRNTVNQTAENCFYAYQTGASTAGFKLYLNRATNCGNNAHTGQYDNGFEIAADDTEAFSNTVIGSSGDGFHVDGKANVTLTTNITIGTRISGFVLDSGSSNVLLDRNKAFQYNSTGISVRAGVVSASLLGNATGSGATGICYAAGLEPVLTLTGNDYGSITNGIGSNPPAPVDCSRAYGYSAY